MLAELKTSKQRFLFIREHMSRPALGAAEAVGRGVIVEREFDLLLFGVSRKGGFTFVSLSALSNSIW